MRNLGFSTKYLNFSKKVRDKVKNKIKELQSRAQTQRIGEVLAHKLDEKMYNLLDRIEGIAWKMRYTFCPTDSLWRTRMKLKRILESSKSDSDEDLELLLLKLEKYGGD
mgnify:CR=1 FL=1